MTAEEFAAAVLARHRDEYSAAAWELAQDAFLAGEFEVAAICAVEDASGITEREIDVLAELSRNFDSENSATARHVIAVARRSLAA